MSGETSPFLFQYRFLPHHCDGSVLLKGAAFRFGQAGKADDVRVGALWHQLTIGSAIPYKLSRVALINELTPTAVDEDFEVIYEIIG